MSVELLNEAARLLTARSGVTVPPYRRPLLAAELERLGGGDLERGFSSFEAGDQASFERMAAIFAVGETYLFRGPDHFRELRRLARRAAEGGRPFNVLCAGVSTGEEAWSAVFVLAESYAGKQLPYSVVGWDLAEDRLERAREARFGRWSARGGLMGCERFLIETVEGYEVVPELRRHAKFEHVNLARPLPAPRRVFDVIFFRNVSIYWGARQASAVAESLAQHLAPGGRLFIGPSDPIRLNSEAWALELVGSALVYRRAERPAEAEAKPTAKPAAPAQAKLARRARSIAAAPTLPRRADAEAKAARSTALVGDELVARVRRLADRGDYDEALALLEGRDLSSPALLELEGIVHLSRGEVDAAIDRFRAAVYWAPTVPTYARWLEMAAASRRRELQDKQGSTRP